MQKHTFRNQIKTAITNKLDLEESPPLENQISLLFQVLNVDGKILFASSSHRNVLRLDPDGLEGISFHDLLHPDDKLQFQSKWKSLKNHKTSFALTAKIQTIHQNGYEFNCLFKWITNEDLELIIMTAIKSPKYKIDTTYHIQHNSNYSIEEEKQYTNAFEKDLSAALTNHELTLYYQPLLNLHTKQLKVEALIRWNHPIEGLLPPSTFIPFAERSGLIVNIGKWVLTEATNQVKKWDSDGLSEIGLSINISAKQVEHPQFVKHVYNALHSSKFPPNKLELELTESSLLLDMETYIPKLEQLRKRGIKISIDDFGTCFSSLNYLKVLPVDILKIDRSFIRDLHKDKSARIIEMIICLAHSLKLDVVAEGVETADQLRTLRDLDCDNVQGYFLSKPLPAHEINTHLTSLKEKFVTYL